MTLSLLTHYRLGTLGQSRNGHHAACGNNTTPPNVLGKAAAKADAPAGQSDPLAVPASSQNGQVADCEPSVVPAKLVRTN